MLFRLQTRKISNFSRNTKKYLQFIGSKIFFSTIIHNFGKKLSYQFNIIIWSWTIFSHSKVLNTNLICSSMHGPCPRLGCAHTNLRSIGVDTRKLTAADHSTPFTEYDMSLHDVPTHIFTFHNFLNAKLGKFKFFSDALKKYLQFIGSKIFFSTIIHKIIIVWSWTFFLRTNYLTLTSYAARCTGLAQGLAALISVSETF